MKKLFALMLGLLSCTLLLCLSVNAVELYVDTELVQTDVPPQLVGGRTLVPMRAIFEYLGAEVTWDNDTRTATGTLNDTVVTIQIDNTTAYVNGVPYTLDVPAQIIGNRTMVPARFVSESLGCVVTWYNDADGGGCQQDEGRAHLRDEDRQAVSLFRHLQRRYLLRSNAR